ncbi:MAG: FGGY-family carbohydrate kinase [Candidatus Hermodarchaeota archaeon]
MSGQKQYVIAHDLGTSANKAVLVDEDGKIHDFVKTEYEVLYPKPGYAEQDPKMWWKAISTTTKQLLEKTKLDQEQVAAVTFSSQMQGLLPINKDHEPLMNSMIWLDQRGAEVLNQLWTGIKVMGYSPLKIWRFLRITGGSPGLAGKDQIPKIHWLQKNRPEIYEETYKFLDTKDYVLYRLTGEIATSTDLAYVWWLMDTRKNKNVWSKGLCKMVKIDINKLPPLKRPTDIIGTGVTEEAAQETGLKPGTPVICGGGDATCAAVGSGNVLDNELHIYLGTSGWVAGHVEERRVDIGHYTGCIGSFMPERYYLVYGHQEVGAGALEWMKNKVLYWTDELEQREHVDRVYQIFDKLVNQAEPGAGGMMFTPWLFGERCPLDDDTIRGSLVNAGLNHDRRHLLRAVFEGIAFNLRWALETVENLYRPVESVNIIGGGAQSDVWCQIFADITKHRINRVRDPQEAGAIGAAMLAWLALKKVSTVEEIKQKIQIDREFVPNTSLADFYDLRFAMFQDLYKRTKTWYAKMNK